MEMQIQADPRMDEDPRGSRAGKQEGKDREIGRATGTCNLCKIGYRYMGERILIGGNDSEASLLTNPEQPISCSLMHSDLRQQ